MMRVTVSWANEEQSIIRYDFVRGWEWRDIHNALDEAHKMVDTVDHRVDVLMDFSSASLLPSGALTQLNMAYRNPKHENIGVTYLIAKSSFVSSIVTMAQKLWGRNNEWDLEFVATEEEALEKIANHDGDEGATDT